MSSPDSSRGPRDDDERGRPPDWLRWSSLGAEFALGIVALGGLGWLADGWLGWRAQFPVCMVAGILGGFAWGVWRLQRALAHFGSERDEPPGSEDA